MTINTQSSGVSPTGSVQLLNNGAPLGTPAVIYGGGGLPPSKGAYAVAGVLFVTPLPGGNLSITAQYSGDANYAGSTSAATTVSVADFSVSANPTTINISAPGQSGTSTLTFTPLYGYNAAVYPGLLTGCPTAATCTVSPSLFNLTGSSTASATFTVTTTASSGVSPLTPQRRVPPGFRLPFGWPWLLAGLLALGTLASLAPARRRAAGWLFATALLLVGVWAACGGSGGGGGGGSSPPAPAPIASLSTMGLTFSQQSVGSTSAAQNATLSNTGNALLSISGIALGGANSGDFAQTNTCGTSVAAGANCTISVTFTPTATGARSASISITDTASGSPHSFHLAGTGFVPTPPGTYLISLALGNGTDSHTVQFTVIVQ